MSLPKSLEHLKISLEEIKLATNNFNDSNFIGAGGFGKVYKGELSEPKGVVAIKRLDATSKQGTREFLTEIAMLSGYKHENLVSLVGFCDDGKEKVLVYELASNGSLEKYLSDYTRLTWLKRLKICVGAARGIKYLHQDVGPQHRVLHRDLKSGNILLDHKWEPKIADFGLSKIGPANQIITFLVSNVAGTMGYCDPLYMSTGVLTKESDMFSFGVVLFEVLCGRLARVTSDIDEEPFLFVLATRCYEERKLDDIIDPNLRKQMDVNSLHSFSSVAYKCLQGSREERPPIAMVLEELELALKFQEAYESRKKKELASPVYDSDAFWEQKLPQDYEEIVRRLNISIRTKKEIFYLLQGGIFFDNGRRLFSIDDNGGNCEMIAARYIEDGHREENLYDYRFNKAVAFQKASKLNLQIRITTEMLSVGVMYSAHLVFRYIDQLHLPSEAWCFDEYVGLKFRSHERMMSSYLQQWREGGWMKIEMWHFLSHKETCEFDVLLEGFSGGGILVDDIEFRPLPMSFSLVEGKKGVVKEKKCVMLSATKLIHASDRWHWDWKSLHESRFSEVAELRPREKFDINVRLRTKLISGNTNYQYFLVYKLAQNYQGLEGALKVRVVSEKTESYTESYIHCISRTPLIKPKNNLTSQAMVTNYRPQFEGQPVQRTDGWMEIDFHPGYYFSSSTMEYTMCHFEVSTFEGNMSGLIIEGIDIRPA